MNASEFQAVQAMLAQQNDFIAQRFDQVGEHAVEIKERLSAVEAQVRITNGTVRKHTDQLLALETPEKLPLMTKAQGMFAQTLLLKGSVVFGAAYAAVQWVLTNWGHVLPLLTGVVR